MKALFLIFHGLEAYSSISKKIRYQVDAFNQCGVDMRLCYIDIDAAGNQKRMVDDQVVECFERSLKGRIKKWSDYTALLQYVYREQIQLIYIHSFHNANPFLISTLRQLKQTGVQVVLEIPTYPYDQQYKEATTVMQFQLMLDKCFRHKLAKHLSSIVTFSEHKEIFRVPTINISNGIDFEAIKMNERVNDTTSQLRLISVAEIHRWHGFDRLIMGLAVYYKTPQTVRVTYDIVGYGAAAEIEKLKQLVAYNQLEEYVVFHGRQFGEELDKLFNQSDMGIASLARHRSNITHVKTLKNREYAARGIPFAYSEIDNDFENMPYILKIAPDESPLSIAALIEFYRSIDVSPSRIRQSVGHLSWRAQMGKLLVQLEGN